MHQVERSVCVCVYVKLETPEGASPDLGSQRSLPAGSGVGEHFVDAVRPFHRLSLGILPQALL